jgi:hypothetical protein
MFQCYCVPMSTQFEVLVMNSDFIKVGMREFRAHLPQYLLTSSPVAITRHGETIGFYIPARHETEKAEIDALKQAALQLDKLLHAHGISEDELLSEFRTLREQQGKQTG